MEILPNILNVRFSTRDLTDEQFEGIVPQLAKELTEVSFYPNHSKEVLSKDWEKLCKYNFDSNFTASTVRVGMKLCEHFFPNFYDIENTKGQTFKALWKDPKVLEKIFRWNRKSHSTPYLSELKRGIYFCCGLTKNTMFRPHLAKIICNSHDGNSVLDPCAGWGGRMLGSVASGKKYIGFEPCHETYENLKRLQSFLGLQNVTLYNDVAENMDNYDFENVDVVLTSPPYFNLEIYSLKGSETQYSEYEDWVAQWLSPLIKQSLSRMKPNGWSCWNVHNIGKMKMISDVENIHNSLNWNCSDEFGISSSKRQANDQRKKNVDLTRIFCEKT